jgi:hypothetical protein
MTMPQPSPRQLAAADQALASIRTELDRLVDEVAARGLGTSDWAAVTIGDCVDALERVRNASGRRDLRAAALGMLGLAVIRLAEQKRADP